MDRDVNGIVFLLRRARAVFSELRELQILPLVQTEGEAATNTLFLSLRFSGLQSKVRPKTSKRGDDGKNEHDGRWGKIDVCTPPSFSPLESKPLVDAHLRAHTN